jgi:hypothetical protein
MAPFGSKDVVMLSGVRRLFAVGVTVQLGRVKMRPAYRADESGSKLPHSKAAKIAEATRGDHGNYRR